MYILYINNFNCPSISLLLGVINLEKNSYNKPLLTCLGKVEELTKGGSDGNDYDEFGGYKYT